MLDGHSLRQRDQGRGDDDCHRLDDAGDSGRLPLRVQMKKMRAVWIAPLILLVATSAAAGMLLLLGVGKLLGSADRHAAGQRRSDVCLRLLDRAPDGLDRGHGAPSRALG